MTMSAIREEVQAYIDSIPDSKLEVLRPLLTLLAEDAIIIDTELTDEEREIIMSGRVEYKQGGYVSLDNI